MTQAEFFEGTGMPDPGWWEALWPDPMAVLSASGIKSGQRVVDLCCGDGWFTLQIAKIAREVIAIDIDPKLLATAQTRLSESGVSNFNLVEANAYDLDTIVGGPVDHVFFANAFHGVPDKQKLAKKVHHILTKGGRFSVVNWHPRPREETRVLGEPRGPATTLRIGPEAVVKSVTAEGFTLDHVTDVGPYHYAAVFEK
jgi:SAM-dependent methyltransferase